MDESPIPRFSLYESVRAFALQRLEQLGEEASIRDQHAALFLSLAEVQAERANGPEAPEAIRWLAKERENLLAAHQHSCEREPLIATRLGLALSIVLGLQAPPAQEEALLNSTVAAARTVPGPWLARALLARAQASRRRGSLAEARQDLEEGSAAAAAAGDPILESLSRSCYAEVLARQGEAHAAKEALRSAQALGEQAGDPITFAWSLLMGAICLIQWGDYDEASSSLEEALPIFRKQGHLRYKGATLLNLGVARVSQIRYREGRHALQEARRVFALLGDEVSDSVAIVNLAALDVAAGHLDEAEHAALEGLALQRKLGNRRVETVALGNLGLIALERGHLKLAERRLQETITVLHELGERRLYGVFLAFLAATEAMLGRADAAASSLEAANEALSCVGDGRHRAFTEALGALLPLARLPAGPRGELERWRREAEEQLALAKALGPAGELTGALAISIRLLEAALSRLGGSPEVGLEEESASAAGLLVGPEAAWFALQGEERVEMRRRAALRRILLALVEQRLLAPGVGLQRDELASIGWPGERILPKAAWNRTRSAISTLRSLGLAPALLRNADGYLLDPELPIHHQG